MSNPNTRLRNPSRRLPPTCSGRLPDYGNRGQFQAIAVRFLLLLVAAASLPKQFPQLHRARKTRDTECWIDAPNSALQWGSPFPNGAHRMIKQDLVSRVINRAGLSRSQSKTVVETILGTMRSALERRERIELLGFAVFVVRPRKTGIGRNPKTGELFPVAGGNAVRFKPGKLMRSI